MDAPAKLPETYIESSIERRSDETQQVEKLAAMSPYMHFAYDNKLDDLKRGTE
ncbi:MAG: hypothetical protein P1U36_05800 [Legionellaceae bacterium]|nr:hypothetical protein [Legionellaceae bacterium]